MHALVVSTKDVNVIHWFLSFEDLCTYDVQQIHTLVYFIVSSKLDFGHLGIIILHHQRQMLCHTTAIFCICKIQGITLWDCQHRVPLILDAASVFCLIKNTMVQRYQTYFPLGASGEDGDLLFR